MYYKLPIKDRMDLMKSYKKTNPKMSYSDMVNDYNTSYQRFKNDGINDDDKNKNLTSEDNKQFLKNMSNSPLFAERYSKMTGSNNPLEVSKYKEDLNTNLNSVKLVDNDLLLKYRKADAAYNPSYHTIYEKKEKDENRYPLNNLHELSHSSTKGELVFKNPYTYNPTEEYYKNEEMKKYLTQPTETKARVDVGRKLLLDNGQYDPINEKFTEDTYEKLKLFGEDKENVQDLIKNYSKEDVIRMFNDITYNKKNNNQLPIARYGGIQRFDNGGKMPKKEINLNIKNQEFNSPVSTWNENLDWQGEKYNDVGLNFNKKNLNIGIGNYVPRSTFEKVGNVNPYLNVSYNLNDRNSIGGNFSKDYNGVSFIRKFDNGGKLSYPQKIQAYNDSTILFNSGFGRGIPNQIYNPQFNAAKKRLTELNKEEPQSTDYYRSYKNNPEYIKTHSIPYAKPTYPKKDTVLPEKKEKTRTDIYTNKDLFDKAYKAETDSSNAYTHYKNDTKGWVPANTVKNENKVKDFVKNNQTLKDAYYNKTEDAITYFPTKPKKPVVHNVYQPPPPPEKMIPIEARIPKDIVEPGLKTSPKDFGYRRIGWRNDPNTNLQVPVLLTHPKMKVKQGERIYNKEIPTSTMAIPKDWEAEFSKPEETKKTDTYWRRK